MIGVKLPISALARPKDDRSIHVQSECVEYSMFDSNPWPARLPAFLRASDGVICGSVERAINTAFIARIFNIRTDRLNALAQPGAELFGMQHSHKGRVVVFGGGIPSQFQGQAIGVSGGSVAEDVAIGVKTDLRQGKNAADSWLASPDARAGAEALSVFSWVGKAEDVADVIALHERSDAAWSRPQVLQRACPKRSALCETVSSTIEGRLAP